jgi:hypothetical protein
MEMILWILGGGATVFLLIVVLRSIKNAPDVKDLADEIAHKPFEYPKEEVIDVAKLLRSGVKRKAIREAVRDFRKHGTHVTLVNRVGLLTEAHHGFRGWVSSRGKFIGFAWGEKSARKSSKTARFAERKYWKTLSLE